MDKIKIKIFFWHEILRKRWEKKVKWWELTGISGKTHAKEGHSALRRRGTQHGSAGNGDSADSGGPWSTTVENGGVDWWNVEGPCCTPWRHLFLTRFAQTRGSSRSVLTTKTVTHAVKCLYFLLSFNFTNCFFWALLLTYLV